MPLKRVPEIQYLGSPIVRCFSVIAIERSSGQDSPLGVEVRPGRRAPPRVGRAGPAPRHHQRRLRRRRAPGAARLEPGGGRDDVRGWIHFLPAVIVSLVQNLL